MKLKRYKFKTGLMYGVIFVIVFVATMGKSFAEEEECLLEDFNRKKKKQLVVADFNKGKKETNLGTKFDSWDKDPADPLQWCKVTPTVEEKVGKKGRSLKIEYDVDAKTQAFNGIWIRLGDLDVSIYRRLVFFIKGSEKGYTKKFKVELKNEDESGSVIVNKIRKKWKRISIPLGAFRGIRDFTKLTEMTIVFEDKKVTTKEGTMYIDEIAFEA